MAWNGPFYIGRIERPASVGDVLMKMLETVWRISILILATALIILAAAGLWYEMISPALSPPLESQLKISAKWDDGKSVSIPGAQSEGCTPEYPILVTIENHSRQAIGSVRFDIEARVPGKSSNVAPYVPERFSDTIIQPGQWLSQCWPTPVEPDGSGRIDPSTLTYTATVRGASSFEEAAQ